MSNDRERQPRDDELPSAAEMLDPRRGDKVKRSYRAVKLTKDYDVVDESEREHQWPRRSMELLTRDLVIVAMLALILLIQVCHTLLLWEPWERIDAEQQHSPAVAEHPRRLPQQNNMTPVATGEASDREHEETAQDDVVEVQTTDDVGAAGET